MGKRSDGRKRLLEAATRLVWENGYESVSVDQICTSTGMNKGSFYYFFRTKEALMLEVMDENLRGQEDHLREHVFADDIPPLERLERLSRYIVEAQMQKREETGHICGCPFGNLGVEVGTRHENVRVAGTRWNDLIISLLTSTLRDAAESGDLEDLDAEAAARCIYTHIQGSLTVAKSYNSPEYLNEQMRNLERLIPAFVVAGAH